MEYYYISFGTLLLCVIISLWAQIKVKTTFAKYDKVFSLKGHTGYSAARQILDSHGLSHVKLEVIRGHLNDHYDPRANVIRLSESVANSYSVAAIGVAAHECGHAFQKSKSSVATVREKQQVLPRKSLQLQLKRYVRRHVLHLSEYLARL